MRRALPAVRQRGQPSDCGGRADRHRCRGETPLRHDRHQTPTPPDQSGDSARSRTAAGDSAAPRRHPWHRSGTSRHGGVWWLRSQMAKGNIKKQHTIQQLHTGRRKSADPLGCNARSRLATRSGAARGLLIEHPRCVHIVSRPPRTQSRGETHLARRRQAG